MQFSGSTHRRVRAVGPEVLFLWETVIGDSGGMARRNVKAHGESTLALPRTDWG